MLQMIHLQQVVGDDNEESATNSGTLILDATCATQNISYPQDVNLLNEAREKLEKMIDIICYEQNYYKPRMYRQKARKDYLNLAKCKKRTAKKIRKAIKAECLDENLTQDNLERCIIESFRRYYPSKGAQTVVEVFNCIKRKYKGISWDEPTE